MAVHLVSWALIPLLGVGYVSAIVLDPALVLSGEVWRVATYLLANQGFGSVALMLLGLFFLGPPVERNLGTGRLLGLYFGTGLLAGLLFTAIGFWVPQNWPLFGAEAADVSLLLAYARLNRGGQLMYAFVLPVKAVYLVWFWVVAKVAAMWEAQAVVWPSVAVLAAAGLSWLLLGDDGISLWNPVARIRYWMQRRKMRKFKVHAGGRKSDPSQYVH
jgi:membrane associated rhomboid family serine protease